MSQNPGRVSCNDTVVRDISGHHRPGTNHDIVSQSDPRNDDAGAPEPAVLPNGHGEGVLRSRNPFQRLDRMGGRVDAHIGSYHSIAPNLHPVTVQDAHSKVDEDIGAELW